MLSETFASWRLRVVAWWAHADGGSSWSDPRAVRARQVTPSIDKAEGLQLIVPLSTSSKFQWDCAEERRHDAGASRAACFFGRSGRSPSISRHVRGATGRIAAA